MIKSTVLYGRPQDPEAFERHYAEDHLPMVAKLPRVRRGETALVMGTRGGIDPRYYRIAELWFDTAEDLEISLSSAEGKAVVADMQAFATGGATVLIAQVD